MNSSMIIHKTFLRRGLFILLIVTMLLLFRQCVIWATTPADYETHDIADYGIYIGNSEEYMYEYIDRFFPAEISEDFQDVTYVFRSRAVDEHAFEAYLEFVIEDEAAFEEHVRLATDGFVSGTFHYDRSFQEYVLHNNSTGMVYDHIMVRGKYSNEEGTANFYQIEDAAIAKILVDYDAQRVIYIAMSVFDGGAADTEFFNEYFNRFGIDPKDYEEYTNDVPSAIHPYFREEG